MSTQLPNRLYTVRMTAWPEESLEWIPEAKLPEWSRNFYNFGERTVNGVTELAWPIEGWEPDGWFEHSTAVWPGFEYVENGIRHFYKPFFWPKTDRIWRSRSSAANVVKIIESWGGKAIILETSPVWESVEDANARRRRERNAPKIARLKAELERLEQA